MWETIAWCAGTGLVVAAWCIVRLRCCHETLAQAAGRLVGLGGGPRPTVPK